MRNEKALSALLTDGIRFDPHYLPSMNSDHMPMTICAMAGLGATLEQIQEFTTGYSKILRPVTTVVSLSGVVNDQWRHWIGIPDGYAELLQYFIETINLLGIDNTVSEYLPEFIDSLALDAFHPIIRLAYGINANSKEEVAASLAYLITTHLSVPADSGKACDLEEQLKTQVAAGKVIEMKSFGDALVGLMRQERYPSGCAQDFKICARMSLGIYQSTRNFFALHMVTATYAVRICANYIDSRRALGALTRALLGAHLVVGSPDFDLSASAPVPKQLDLPHAYKYLYVCLQEYQLYGDKRYLKEIADFKEMGLVPDWVNS
ncbi:MAG: hypothetical protein ACJAVI_000019 [Candidatus Azotimanducaceae bacterium]|jgi:hypothetical protein